MNDALVRTARPEDRDRLVTTLTAAFATDAVTSWLLGPRRARRRHLLRFFTTLVSPSVVADGGCDLTSGGAAVWYRPGAYEATAGVSPLELVRLAAGFGARLPTVARADAAMRAHHPSEPHWYLQFVGVEPARTGRGTGSRLLAHRLEQIDEAGEAAYLESSSARNLPLYERHGFVVTDEIRLAPDAPPEWLMWRAARTPRG